jgi:hypothetical protein
MGYNDTTRQADAGKIEYGSSFNPNALSIIGKGTTSGTRYLDFYDNVIVEQDLTVKNNLSLIGSINGILTSTIALLSANNAFTGVNTVPTPSIATNNTQIATCNFVYSAINNIPKPLTVQIYDNASAGATFNTVGSIPWSHSYTSSGGKLLILASFTAYSTAVQACAFNLLIDGAIIDTVYLPFNQINVNLTLPSFFRVNNALSIGSHTFGIQIGTSNTTIDTNNHLNFSVIEFA